MWLEILAGWILHLLHIGFIIPLLELHSFGSYSIVIFNDQKSLVK